MHDTSPTFSKPGLIVALTPILTSSANDHFAWVSCAFVHTFDELFDRDS